METAAADKTVKGGSSAKRKVTFEGFFRRDPKKSKPAHGTGAAAVLAPASEPVSEATERTEADDDQQADVVDGDVSLRLPSLLSVLLCPLSVACRLSFSLPAAPPHLILARDQACGAAASLRGAQIGRAHV
jgi:hypothetical protein